MAYEDITYCTVDNIKTITAIVQTVDAEYIQPFILSAEEMHIIPVLGDALDSELKTDIEQSTLSGDNETLVLNYIIPASAWYSFYDGVPFLSQKITNKGLNQNFSSTSTPSDLEQEKHYQQKVKDKAVFYLNRMRTFLDDNQDLYSNYRNDTCGNQGRSWATGIWLP